jgi:2,3-bisphosphoglycerate-dependent phosphoglycerate mutase
MADKGLDFDICFTSLLTRAIKTLDIALDRMDRLWLPVLKHWRLNERHYGGLTGLNKQKMRDQVGDEQVKIWRRSFDIPPPPLASDSEYDVAADRRYQAIEVPNTESLKDTIERVLPYWDEAIAPALKSGQRVIISAHGNSIRALVKHLSGLGNEEIVGVEIPTGQPLVYELNDDLSVADSYYLNER